MTKNKRGLIVSYSLIAVCSLYVIEQIIIPGYFVKSISKALFFLAGSILLQRAFGIGKDRKSLRGNAHISREKLAALGLLAFISVLAAFALLRTQIDLRAITAELENTLDVNAGNFIAVGAYITFVNAAMEEIFFRGFIFMNLEKNSRGEKWFAYLYSSALFSLYHISIFKTWFNFGLQAAALAGLMAAGMFFDYIDEKCGSILCSYIVHACGDAAIVFIGLKMFGLL